MKDSISYPLGLAAAAVLVTLAMWPFPKPCLLGSPVFRPTPEQNAAMDRYFRECHLARTWISEGHPQQALDLLGMAKTGMPGANSSRPIVYGDPLLAADALIFLRRYDEALAALQSSYRDEAEYNARMGLAFALSGNIDASLGYDPRTQALDAIGNARTDAIKTLPYFDNLHSLAAESCLAIACAEADEGHDGIAERYYKLGLHTRPGDQLLSLSYAAFLQDADRAKEALPLLRYVARSLPGKLRMEAQAMLNDAQNPGGFRPLSSGSMSALRAQRSHRQLEHQRAPRTVHSLHP
jgi:hypothetical protein